MKRIIIHIIIAIIPIVISVALSPLLFAAGLLTGLIPSLTWLPVRFTIEDHQDDLKFRQPKGLLLNVARFFGNYIYSAIVIAPVMGIGLGIGFAWNAILFSATEIPTLVLSMMKPRKQ